MFVLSKIFTFFLAPSAWIFLLLILFFLSKKPIIKRNIKLMMIGLFLLFSNPFLYHQSIMAYQAKPVSFSKEQQFETGILLGGLSGYDKNNKGFFAESSDRFIATVNLYHQGIIKKIIVTGGSGNMNNSRPETIFLSEELLKNGIPAADILLEHRSKNTYENAFFTKALIDSMQLKGPFVLITSALHMPRSIRLFEKARINIQPFPCNYFEYEEVKPIYEWLYPDVRLLEYWKYFIKEIAGSLLYQLVGKA